TKGIWKKVSWLAHRLSFRDLLKKRNQIVFKVEKVGVPPVKCQGIKTKLVPFILENIRWSESETGRWIEPFLGSGVVAFNFAPQKALLADTNSHIIKLYQSIQKAN